MGGVLILLGLFSGILLWCDLSNHFIWFLIFIVGCFGLLGAYDDYRKIKYKNSSGVSFTIKIVVQNLITVQDIVIFLADCSRLRLMRLVSRGAHMIIHTVDLLLS